MNSQFNTNTTFPASDQAAFYHYIGQLYPFGFALDRNLEIVWEGSTFRKISKGRPDYFTNNCHIKRPMRCDKEFGQLKYFSDLLFVIETALDDNELTLKGQFIFQSEYDHLVFCGSALVNNEETLTKTGLSISDFSVNDPALDALNMISFHKLSIEDMNRLFQDAESKTIEISKQRIFYEKILNNIPADIAIFNSEQTYLFLNKEAVANADLRKWLIGKNDFDYCRLKGTDTTMAEKRNAIFKQACQTRAMQEWTEEHQKQGKKSLILRRFLPYFENDKVSFVIGYGIDITNLIDMQHQLHEQNELMSTILGTITDGFLSMDNNLTVRYWNKKASEVTKIDSEFIIGKHFKDAVDTNDGQRLLNHFSASLSEQEHKQFEFFYSPRQEWFEISCYPNNSGLSVFFRSIQDRKILEAERTRELELALALNQFSKNIITSYDEHEIFWTATETVIKVLDLEDCVFYRWDSTNGKLVQVAALDNKRSTHRHIPNPVLLSLGEGIVGSAGRSHKPQLVPNTLVDTRYIADDKPRASELAVPILIGDELIGVLDSESSTPGFFNEYHLQTFQRISDIIALKISEIRAQEKALEEKEFSLQVQRSLNEKIKEKSTELERSNKELEYFAYTVSHDLQEPLRMITTFLEKLQQRTDSQLDKKSQQYIDLSMDGARRMHQNIKDLLEYSRASNLDRSTSLIKLQELTDRICRSLQRMIRETGATITYDGVPIIQGYPTPLMHVLQNLIDNALKYRRPGIPPVIRIECRENPDHYMFSVSDNGLGIPEEFRERAFKIFQQLQKSHEGSGSGVGLAIVKKIIENLNGNIWIESAPEHGTIFQFTIPK